MSSFLDDSIDKRKKFTQSELNKTQKEKDMDLFPHNNTKDEKNSKILSDMEITVQSKSSYVPVKTRGGTSNRKYRKQNFQLQRNDPLLNINNILSNNNATNQTMQMFASSNVASPAMSSMGLPPNFILASTTKNSHINASKRPVSAVMAKRMSPNSSIDLPSFDLKRTRAKNIKTDKVTLYEDAMKLKKFNNTVVDENIKLKTNLAKLEAECGRKEKLLEDILMSKNQLDQRKLERIRQENNVPSAIRKHIRELKVEIQIKDEEIQRLKKNIRITRFQELEREVKVYMDE